MSFLELENNSAGFSKRRRRPSPGLALHLPIEFSENINLYLDSAEKPPVFEKRAVKRLVKNASREKQNDPGAIFIV
jgi:hypothetical protein